MVETEAFEIQYIGARDFPMKQVYEPLTDGLWNVETKMKTDEDEWETTAEYQIKDVEVVQPAESEDNE